MFGLKSEELIVILIIFILLFGAKKIPELSKSLADAFRELRRGFSDDVKEEGGKKSSSEKKENS